MSQSTRHNPQEVNAQFLRIRSSEWVGTFTVALVTHLPTACPFQQSWFCSLISSRPPHTSSGSWVKMDCSCTRQKADSLNWRAGGTTVARGATVTSLLTGADRSILPSASQRVCTCVCVCVHVHVCVCVCTCVQNSKQLRPLQETSKEGPFCLKAFRNVVETITQ